MPQLAEHCSSSWQRDAALSELILYSSRHTSFLQNQHCHKMSGAMKIQILPLLLVLILILLVLVDAASVLGATWVGVLGVLTVVIGVVTSTDNQWGPERDNRGVMKYSLLSSSKSSCVSRGEKWSVSQQQLQYCCISLLQ